MPDINGTKAAEILEATVNRTIVQAFEGDDTLKSGNTTDNQLYGDEGNDLLLGGNGDRLYGGIGSDTLEGGDSSKLYGGRDNDTYIVKWSTFHQENDDKFSTHIFEDYGVGSGGVDTVDLSHIVSSKSRVEVDTEKEVILDTLFFNTDHTLKIHNSSGALIGYVFIDGDIEQYKIGNTVYTLPASDSRNKDISNSLGASSGDDILTARPSSEHTRLYGYGGNDTLKAGSQDNTFTQAIYGGLGDDLIQNGLTNEGGRFYGGEGNDTYRIQWSGELAKSHYKLTIYEYSWAADSDNDVLDLSQQVPNLSQIRFDDGLYNSLDVDVLNASGEKIGRINIRGSHEAPDTINIEKIITADGVFVIPKGATPEELEDLRKEILADVERTPTAKASGELLEARDGGDAISGMGGSDTINGNDGNDTLVGGAGADFLYGKDGEDTIWAGKDDDAADLIVGGGEGDMLGGGPGNDSIEGDNGILGVFDAGPDTIFGGAGDDLLIGGGWLDRPSPGEVNRFSSDEVVTLSSDNNIIWGGSGDDSIFGTHGDEQLGGGAGADFIRASNGDDVIYGGTGDGADLIEGGSGKDTVFGGAGNDNIQGGAGADLLYNGAGNDTVLGNDGSDTLWGGSGNDRLTGGFGADVFAFGNENGLDIVTDFKKGEDIIELSAFSLTDLASSASSDTQNGILGVRLTLSAGTQVFLEHLSINDISNDMAVLS
ncbi:MAG: calcium-binding protein [Kordiimonas sp.]